MSCLLSTKEEARQFTTDEVEDAMHTLDFADKQLDFRAVSTCLEVLYKHAAIHACVFGRRKPLF